MRRALAQRIAEGQRAVRSVSYETGYSYQAETPESRSTTKHVRA
jgi:hypothetical protein